MLDDAKYVRNFRLVRYEQFVDDPLGVTEELAGFIGINPAPLRPVVLNGWRFGNMDSKPSKLRNANPDLIGRLSSQEIALITVVASEMLEHLGYDSVQGVQTTDGRT